jgi:hypothetical protein
MHVLDLIVLIFGLEFGDKTLLQPPPPANLTNGAVLWKEVVPVRAVYTVQSIAVDF